ncbi:class IIc cyclic bacteriocin [Lactobacillus delbrueckii]|uniref:class IIc cyclic bacteriocin n=1 Tax=Lactobacillus delbrueckii TaxID=1584 RepID=UPI001F565B8F|nr:class IIc cyclic bacteriocin [Lactobacillus delbrueckii]UNL39454.1 class IIc cyclic bacteriocin [Lactobacillus delbrueckii]
MVTKYGRNLGLSKVELFAIWAVLVVALLLATVNIYWIADQFGIHLATGTTRKLLDAVSAGASLGTAFATVLGVTLPAWAVAAAGAVGVTAA